MNTIVVKIDDLVARLNENRGGHREKYLAAVERFREEAVRVFSENLENAKAGRPFVQHLNLPVPQDHTSDYDRALRMLEMTKAAGEQTIEIDTHDFAQYVEDDWQWRQQWQTINASYGVR